MHDLPRKDRRVQKTRALLVDAITSLIHDKPYDAIVVKEILHRANVGRSTFYAHFRDKDELLSTAMSGLLGRLAAAAPSTPRSERVLRFSLPILEHIDRHHRDAGRQASTRGMTKRGRAILHGRLEQQIAKLITDEVGGALREQSSSRAFPGELLVGYVTSNFTMVLDWWVDHQSQLTPAEVDRLFRGLVLPVLSRALD